MDPENKRDAAVIYSNASPSMFFLHSCSPSHPTVQVTAAIPRSLGRNKHSEGDTT